MNSIQELVSLGCRVHETNNGELDVMFVGRTISPALVSCLTDVDRLDSLTMRCDPESDDDFGWLEKCNNLRSLSWSSRYASDALVCFVSQLPRLEELQLSGSKITNNSFRYFSKMDRLHSLDISGAAVDDSEVHHLLKLRNLSFLDLGKTQISKKTLGTLRDSSISKLVIRKTRISQLVALADWSNLLSLNINSIPLGDSEIECVSQFRFLEHLAASCTGIGNRGLAALAKCLKLSRLDVDQTTVDDVGLTELCNLQTLSDLSIHGTQCTLQGVQQLKKALPSVRVWWDQPFKKRKSAIEHLGRLTYEGLDLE